MGDRSDLPPELVARLGKVCLELPDAYEEDAWIGVRWRVRKQTFAHVFGADLEWVAGFAPALAAPDGPGAVHAVLTFRSEDPERDVLLRSGLPFFPMDWGPTVIGMLLDDAPDWREIEELLTESYCLRAPKKLIALVDRPGEAG
ncbi:MmcQ/YjbR family DNA-binding protein [Flindersiella endophytica]